MVSLTGNPWQYIIHSENSMATTMTKTLPPEWAAQEAVLLAWPQADSDWSPWLQAIETCYVAMAQAIAPHQRVIILCQDGLHQQHIQSQLPSSDAISLYPVPYSDTWIRDYGPITVLDDKQIHHWDFQFNAWGNKYHNQHDNQVNAQLAQQGILKNLSPVDFILEGGAIETNGQGDLLMTRSCTFERNPNIQERSFAEAMQTHFQIKKIHCLDLPLLDWDDTDGHIDTLARFAGPNEIVYLRSEDAQDPYYSVLVDLEKQLQSLRNQQGKAFHLTPLPMTAARHNKDGQRLPTSYANFLIINDAVLAPTYHDEADEEALNVLAQSFPKRTIIAIDASVLVEQFGSIHCATMQIPKEPI